MPPGPPAAQIVRCPVPPVRSMKSTLTFIAVCIVASLAVHVLHPENSQEQDRPSLTRRQTNLVSTPIPDEKIAAPLQAREPRLRRRPERRDADPREGEVRQGQLAPLRLRPGPLRHHVRPPRRLSSAPSTCRRRRRRRGRRPGRPSRRPTPRHDQLLLQGAVQRTFEEENQARLAYEANKAVLQEERQQADMDDNQPLLQAVEFRARRASRAGPVRLGEEPTMTRPPRPVEGSLVATAGP